MTSWKPPSLVLFRSTHAVGCRMNELFWEQPMVGECRFSSTCLYISEGAVKGRSPKYNGLEQLVAWFRLPVPATSAFSCWRKICWRTRGSVQMAGSLLERGKVLSSDKKVQWPHLIRRTEQHCWHISGCVHDSCKLRALLPEQLFPVSAYWCKNTSDSLSDAKPTSLLPLPLL